MVVHKLASFVDGFNCRNNTEITLILHQCLAPVHQYANDETSTCRRELNGVMHTDLLILTGGKSIE